MLKLSDLALRADVQLGPMLVSPSRRLVEGPGGHTHLEPLIMQVFLLLLDSGGKVVTRKELFDQCWGGVIVGDDSLNRAILKVRRTGAHVAPGLFEVETIPRTGYRLTGEILGLLNGRAAPSSSAAPTSSKPISRRAIVGATAGAVAFAGAGSWLWTRSRTDARFDELMSRSEDAFRSGSAFEGYSLRANRSPKMIQLYEEAVRLRPDSAKAWGLLAYFLATESEDAPTEQAAPLAARSQDAIRRALELSASEPSARLAMYLFQGRTLDWLARDKLLRGILSTDPNHLPAMGELMALLQATGLTRESWVWNERILKASPFARPFLVVRAMKLWILGRMRDSDSVIDRVRGLWPDYPFGYWVRFILFVLTDRPRAARALLDDAAKTKAPAEPEMWRAVLDALETRSPSSIEAAQAACIDVARRVPIMVNDMVMMLCALGKKDTAFEVTEGFLLWRGNIVSTGQQDGKAMDDYSRRMTQWLFTPPVAIMRSDPRFLELCEEFGLTAYWEGRNLKPDYQLYG
jgi:DNA-binding winged helix-turn-helix (wHTH) protein